MTNIDKYENLSKQADEFIRNMFANKRVPIDVVMKSKCILDMLGSAKRFILPVNGIASDDFMYKALANGVPFRLPFDSVAIEFPVQEKDGCIVDRCVVFAKESENKLGIEFWPIVRYKLDKFWDIHNPGVIPFDCVNRDVVDVTTNRAQIKFGYVPEFYGDKGFYGAFAGVVVSFVNALACSNVGFNRFRTKNEKSSFGEKYKDDEYHILFLKDHKGCSTGNSRGSGRSPREHVRRGHVRRLSDGRSVWVNATVVASGSSGGVVSKGYSVS